MKYQLGGEGAGDTFPSSCAAASVVGLVGRVLETGATVQTGAALLDPADSSRTRDCRMDGGAGLELSGRALSDCTPNFGICFLPCFSWALQKQRRMSSLLLSGTMVLLSQIHPAGSSDARGCAQPQCYCWDWSWDGCTAGVPTSLCPAPGKSQEKGAWMQPDLARMGSHPPLTLCPSCLCRCAGSLPPRLVLRAGSPVSSAECRVSAPILLCWLGTTSTFTLSFPHCHSRGLQQLRVSGHSSAHTQSPVALLSPEGDVRATIHLNTFPRALGQDGKAPSQREVL